MVEDGNQSCLLDWIQTSYNVSQTKFEECLTMQIIDNSIICFYSYYSLIIQWKTSILVNLCSNKFRKPNLIQYILFHQNN